LLWVENVEYKSRESNIPVITCKTFFKEIIENKTNYTPLSHSSTLINGLRCHQITCAGAETQDPKIDQLGGFCD